MTSPRSALIVGCGYLGAKLKDLLEKNQWTVDGIGRNLSPCVNLKIDVGQAFHLTQNYDAVFYMISADSYTQEHYEQAYVTGVKNTLGALHSSKSFAHMFFVSSTSLFSENSGGTIDESSDISTKTFSAHSLHQGEELIRRCGLPYSIVRAAGIYGQGRCSLIEKVKSGNVKLKLNPYISNRIHVDDSAGILHHLTQVHSSQQIYIASDSEPTPYNEIIFWLSKELNIDPDKFEYDKTASKRMSHKFCSNKKILATHYTFKHPNFRSGLRSCL